MLDSRPVHHRNLKRALSPGFTVAYVDNLETTFAGVVRDLLNKYATRLHHERGQPFEVDFMNDLHNVALDM